MQKELSQHISASRTYVKEPHVAREPRFGIYIYIYIYLFIENSKRITFDDSSLPGCDTVSFLTFRILCSLHLQWSSSARIIAWQFKTKAQISFEMPGQ
jgi:hypothetical protein